MTTLELEMPAVTTANHRCFDEMMVRSSGLLNNAAHAYMNSSCSQVLLTSSLYEDEAELPILPMQADQYCKSAIPYEGHDNMEIYHQRYVNTIRPEPEGSAGYNPTTDFINVDNVPSELTASRGSKAEMYMDMNAEPFCYSWATSLPIYQFDTKTQQPNPPCYVNSYLMDDIMMMNDTSTLSSLLSSVHGAPPQSANMFSQAPQQYSCPPFHLNLNHMQNAGSTAACSNPLNVSQVIRPPLEEIEQLLDGGVAPAPMQASLPGDLFDDASFPDGQFVSAFFSDNVSESKEGNGETAIYMGGISKLLHNNHLHEPELVGSGHPFGSQLVCEADDVDAGAFRNGDGWADNNVNQANKRARKDKDQGHERDVPKSKRACIDTSPTRSNEILSHDEVQQHEKLHHILLESKKEDTLLSTTSRVVEDINIADIGATSLSSPLLPMQLNVVDDTTHHKIADNTDGTASLATDSTTTPLINTSHESRNHKNSHAPPSQKNTTTTSTKVGGKSTTRTNKQSTACDPQSIAARHRRERISERLKILQELVPNGSKVDIVTMLEKAINYVKFLQLQVKVLTTDEYWPNCQKLSQPNEMNLLSLLLSKSKEEDTTSEKSETPNKKTSKS